MGCDCSNEHDESISYYKQQNYIQVAPSEIPSTNRIQFQPYLQSKSNPNFNFPEVEDEQYSGSGIKQMKGYISNISKEELLKKRKEFWETRIEGNKDIWAFLQRICEEPEFEKQDVSEYLKAMEIVPYSNCINVTYDSLGYLYEIPNYCINMPLKYDLPGDDKNKPKDNKEIVTRLTEIKFRSNEPEEDCREIPRFKGFKNVDGRFYGRRHRRNYKH